MEDIIFPDKVAAAYASKAMSLSRCVCVPSEAYAYLQ